MPPVPAPTPPHAAATQVALLSIVFFCCPGLFNALSSIAGGLPDATVAFRGNVLVYLCFAVASAAAAALLPTLGARRSLALGSLGYVTYTLSLWAFSAFPSPATVALFYAASATLGVAAGFLWTAQGQMIMGYATARNQGRYLSVFWIIFNLGAACGGLLTCFLNWTTPRRDATGVSHVTFVAFAGISTLGAWLALTRIAPLERVVKDDGTRVINPASTTPKTTSTMSWRDDARALLVYVTTSRELALLLPFFVYSNWFYTYHAFFNVAVFNTRTSGLASASYWTAQMLAALVLGRVLDQAAATEGYATSSTAVRTAYGTLALLAVVWNGMWAIGSVTQSSLALAYEHPLALDVVDDTAHALGPFVLYTIYGAGDALGQVWIYWYLSSVSPQGREPRIAGFHAGIYKSVQALSAAVAWGLGAQRVAPTTQLWINWVLCNAALVGAAWSLRRASKEPQQHEETRVLCGDATTTPYRSTTTTNPHESV